MYRMARLTMNHQLATVTLLGFSACGSLSAGPVPSVESANDIPDAGGHGQFFIRVLPTGEVDEVDPILAPGGPSPHTHVFFGAEAVTSTSTRGQLVAGGTTAQDPKDHSAYWVPQLFFRGQPWNPGCTGTPPDLTCGSDPSTTYYVRAYYTTVAGAATVQLPRIAMVTGYPGATSDPASQDPRSTIRVRYTCGGDQAKGVVTPTSTWPYSCGTFGDPFDGVVMIAEFPDCWAGTVSGSLDGERVVQYVDSNVEPGVTNDVAYANASGACPVGFPFRIPRVSIHVHTLIENPATGDKAVILPSSCSDSTFPSCTVGTEPPATGPRSIAIGLSSDAGTPGGWYTFHADYLQAWQMGTVTDPFSTSPPPDQDANERPGTLNDLTEDCLDAAVRCGAEPDGMGGYDEN